MPGTVYKCTAVFSYSPTVAPGALTRLRQGGWSENWFQLGAPIPATFTAFANARAGMLPLDCTMVGWRSVQLNWSGNLITQGLVQVGDLNAAGTWFLPTVDPDTCLILRGQSPGNKVQTKYNLHNLPALVTTGSQYTPGATFTAALRRFINFMLGSGSPQCWFGRDPATVKVRVLSYNPATLVVATLGNCGAAPGQSVRFFRVTSELNTPVEGSYVVVSNAPIVGTANWAVTLASGPPTAVVKPSGFLRIDQLATQTILSITPHLVADRKIGRPSSLFRGRRTA